MAKYGVHESWFPLFDKWSTELDIILADVYSSNSKIKTFPNQENVFRAFDLSINNIKLVFLGQDCYHGVGQAMGLAFSVPHDCKIPPSLVNIFKELKTEFPNRNYNYENGDLSLWSSREGIFLLNAALTVKQASPLSHIKKWETFTDDVVKYIMQNNNSCIFLLLGNYAKSKSRLITSNSILSSRIVKGVHPSPLSAHNGFFNSNIFLEVETKLGQQINWQN